MKSIIKAFTNWLNLLLEILNSYNSPIHYCADFKNSMVRSRIEERRRKEYDKQFKAQEKVNSRLGIAAKVK